jgi:CPA2 family monovalent cation:H+ antiporter-2
LLLAVYLSNHLINAIVLQFFSKQWKRSLYGGAFLAQIGELGFVLISTAYYSNIISDFSYQLTIVTIALTLLLSPFWITLTRKILGFDKRIQ